MLTLVAFLLPPDAGEKIGLTITILLSLTVFQLIVADMVPSTSLAVPLVGVYFACVMFMCTLSVIMAVFVLNMHHRSPDMHTMPSWIQTMICGWLAWALRMSRPGQPLSRRLLMRRAGIRRLEARCPPSISLLANVVDDPSDQYSALPSVLLPTTDNCCSEAAARRGRSDRWQQPTPYTIDITSSVPTSRRDRQQLQQQQLQHLPRSHQPKVSRSTTTSTDSPPRSPGGGGCCGCCCCRSHRHNAAAALAGGGSELGAVLRELRHITGVLRDDEADKQETNDWKFAAMVVDRLCFYAFSFYLVVVTAAIFLAAEAQKLDDDGAAASQG
jgi:nicotinic acetylcholine receptor